MEKEEIFNRYLEMEHKYEFSNSPEFPLEDISKLPSAIHAKKAIDECDTDEIWSLGKSTGRTWDRLSKKAIESEVKSGGKATPATKDFDEYDRFSKDLENFLVGKCVCRNKKQSE